MDTILSDLEHAGFATVADALSSLEVQALLQTLGTMPHPTDEEARAGQRDLFTKVPAVRELAAHSAVRGWPAAVLGPACFAVRAILFDKTPAANWRVAWHQDLTIPTRRQLEAAGFGPWSLKAGIPHVQPPAAILERMLTVRVHLDPCDSMNGPVRVLPGSHRDGKLSPEGIETWKAVAAPVDALAPAGGLLLMRPLLLHASSPAQRPGHRRVIHLEYAVDPLPDGLEWRERWGAGLQPNYRMKLTRLGRRFATT
jgi:ectoine hydroxylase-related dioxygenase (phytanoyl-CoA dioxygenase family)